MVKEKSRWKKGERDHKSFQQVCVHIEVSLTYGGCCGIDFSTALEFRNKH